MKGLDYPGNVYGLKVNTMSIEEDIKDIRNGQLLIISMLNKLIEQKQVVNRPEGMPIVKETLSTLCNPKEIYKGNSVFEIDFAGTKIKMMTLKDVEHIIHITVRGCKK